MSSLKAARNSPLALSQVISFLAVLDGHITVPETLLDHGQPVMGGHHVRIAIQGHSIVLGRAGPITCFLFQ